MITTCESKTSRNGEIELLRFLFALFVMMFHYGYSLQYFPLITVGGYTIRLANRGGESVTWFFLLSGFFLGMSAKGIANSRTEKVGKCTGKFVKKKYAQYMAWFMPAFISATILVCVQNGILKAIFEAFCGIPNILLLGSLGFGLDASSHIGIHVGASWYLSALFLCQMVLFPIIIKNYDIYIHVIAPIAGALTMGFMFAGIFNFGLVFPKPMCLIILGTVAYEMTEKLNTIKIEKRVTVLLNIGSRFIWVIYLVYLCIEGHEQMEYALIFLMMCSLSFVFSNHGRAHFFDNKVCYFLGSISFPLYMLHMQVLLWAEYCSGKTQRVLSKEQYYIVLILIAIIISAVAFCMRDWCLKKRKARLVRE